MAFAANADTWKVNANTWAIQIPPNTTYTVGYQRISKATGAALGSGQSTAGTTVGAGTTITYNAPNMTDSQDFRAEFGYWANSAWKKLKWVNSYNYSTNPNGGTSNGGQNSGGYNDNDDMTDANGNPVDANGNPVPAEGYKETTKITNNDNTPMIVRVTLKDANGNIISQRQITVPPNSTTNVVNKLDQPFTASYDKATYYDPDTGGGAGWESLGSGHQASSSAGGGGYSGGGSSSATNTPTPSTTPTATPSESRPNSGTGELEANAEARHKELMKELQRGTNMQKTGIDQAHGDQLAAGQKGDLGNSLLKGIKKGIEDLKGNGDGSGNTGGGYLGNVPDAPDESAKVTSLAQGYNLLKSDINALLGKWQSYTGSAALVWSFNVMGYDINLSLEPYADIIAAVRSGEVMLLSAFALISAVRIVRGGLTDAGG